MRVERLALALSLCLGATSCARRAPDVWVGTQTCVVLSVGGLDGVAHAGALEAVREAGLEVDCVVGNSMGSLVGGLYAADPSASPRQRLRDLLAHYREATERVVRRRALGVGALTFVVGLLSGGIGAGLLAGGAGVYVGARSTTRLDWDRMVEVYDEEVGGASIERLPRAFATFHQAVIEGGGVRRVTVTEGPLSLAVGRSIANPLIFEDVNLRERGILDPGADRVSATPVEDACEVFPGARLLAINVTAEPAYYRADIGCAVKEVRVDVPAYDAEEVAALGDDFEAVADAGYRATCAVLGCEAVPVRVR
ncbi:MAG: patatin-like phospholipase family protein [Myxococcota bacterium]